MSEANAEVVRRWLWAFENDAEAFRETLHPEIEWSPFEDSHTTSYGVEAAMRIRTQWLDAWDEHRVELEDVAERGEDVVASIHVITRGKASGVDVDVRLFGHFRVRDGKIAYVFEYVDQAEALEAAGLSDQA